MNQSQTPPRLNRFTYFVLTGSTTKKVILFGGLFWLIMSLLGIGGYTSAHTARNDSSGAYVVLLAISLAAAIGFGFAMAQGSKTQRRRLEKALGITLTADDQVALVLWQQRGVKPQAKHLQPVLASYVTHQENTLTGRTSTVSPKAKMLFFAVSCYNFVLHITGAIQHPARRRWFDVLLALSSLFLMLLFFPQKSGRPNLLLTMLGRRQLRKVARMRAQLSA